tara:strand:- start:2639 stop:3391 length:753 start_codon:yes stop_codon:yes gene_type:complete
LGWWIDLEIKRNDQEAMKFIRLAVFSLLISCVHALPLQAVPLDINWANSFSNVVTNGGPFDPAVVLGTPDGIASGLHEGGAGSDGIAESATFGGFGTGDKTTTDSASLATLLGVSEAVVNQADFIAFDGQGAPFPFKTSDWEFSDGVNTFNVNYTALSSLPVGVLATGYILTADYDNFFGPLTSTASAGFGFLLFDIDGNSSVDINSANFTADIASGTHISASADPDAMGRIGAARRQNSSMGKAGAKVS